MAKAPPTPHSAPALKEADYRLINQALYKLSEAADEMDKAEKAGIDVTTLREMHGQVQAQLDAVKQIYFPGRQ